MLGQGASGGMKTVLAGLAVKNIALFTEDCGGVGFALAKLADGRQIRLTMAGGRRLRTRGRRAGDGALCATTLSQITKK